MSLAKQKADGRFELLARGDQLTCEILFDFALDLAVLFDEAQEA